IRVATEMVNLIASYQPAVARQQFSTARNYLSEPALTVFDENVMKTELRNIEETNRSQIFFVRTNAIKVERFPNLDNVIVQLPGWQKVIGSTPLASEELVYHVKMTTTPRNEHNEFGIMIIDIKSRAVNSETTRQEDLGQNELEESDEKAIS